MTRRSFFRRAAAGALTALAAVYVPGLTVRLSRYKLRTLLVGGQTIPIPDSVPALSRAEIDNIVAEMIIGGSRHVAATSAAYFYEFPIKYCRDDHRRLMFHAPRDVCVVC